MVGMFDGVMSERKTWSFEEAVCAARNLRITGTKGEDGQLQSHERNNGAGVRESKDF